MIGVSQDRRGLTLTLRLTQTLTALTLASLLLTGCGGDAKSEEAASDGDKKKEEEVALPVEVSKASSGLITATLTSTSTLEAEEQASVVAKVSGVVTKLFVEEGQMVKAGDPLIQLDTERLQLEVARAESNLAKLASDRDRTKQLFEKKLVSSDAYDKIKFEYDSLKASHDLAKLDLAYGTVRAPISGVVSKRMVKVGNMVQLNQPVFEITDFDPLLAVIHVPERELAKLTLNQAAVITVDARRDQLYPARILRISPIIDAASGTFKVTLAVNDSKRELKPGMFGRVAVTYAQHDNAVLIAKDAVLNEDGETAVFVIRDNKAYRTPVETGFTDDKHMEILKGIAANDLVVTTGQNSLKHEASVQVLNP
ncbi:efflux RND transporter periplasmic adaptor subunit [Permianibacter sp. IMCC34836]|uniref:efflux RND transporter periplasmic adaptor subunit n=1 Tax=Permianibacter fluminis TaxID=2738515 RepID=UPI0015570EC5|nr:efflux RND transporter periplasmic adaptor subunit [Permianibacter fluminis]NQD37554.1 efflux RND transporter periplasmic adaptor subunit [Permianibacter fluminis]